MEENENEEWVGIYFRVPASLKEEFLEAVAATYGHEKGAVGQCLRDLIKDFIDIVNRTETAEVKTRILKRVLSKQTELTNIPTHTYFSTIEKTTWGVFEELLKAIWAKLGYYPPSIPLKDLETLFANIRGNSRSTIWKWKKKLTASGLIAIHANKALINYPIISQIETIEHLKTHKFNHDFAFALISPFNDIIHLTYMKKVNMNPDHYAIIDLEIKPDGYLIRKEFVPEHEWGKWANSINEPTPYTTNVPLLKLFTALIRWDSYKIILPYNLDTIANLLAKLDPTLKPEAVLPFPEL